MSSELLADLICQRDSLEAEAEAITDHLTSPGPNGEPPAGVKDPLVDNDGFPRADIDIHQVRIKRNRLAIINTDHKALMRRIKEEVEKLHSSSPSVSIPATSSVSVSESDKKIPSILIPFAKIDEIQTDSPADMAGLHNGDLLISFGSVDISVLNPMKAIPLEVSKYSNKQVEIVILRDNENLVKTLVPTIWSGRGLLGCHLSPL